LGQRSVWRKIRHQRLRARQAALGCAGRLRPSSGAPVTLSLRRGMSTARSIHSQSATASRSARVARSWPSTVRTATLNPKSTTQLSRVHALPCVSRVTSSLSLLPSDFAVNVGTTSIQVTPTPANGYCLSLSLSLSASLWLDAQYSLAGAGLAAGPDTHRFRADLQYASHNHHKGFAACADIATVRGPSWRFSWVLARGRWNSCVASNWTSPTPNYASRKH
jgi:hypothetical protein